MLLSGRVFDTAYVIIRIADYIVGIPNFVFFTLKTRLLTGYCLYSAIGKKWKRTAEI